MGYLTNFIVYTLAMVGLMMFALFIFKKTTSGNNGVHSKYLKVIDSISIGPRKNLYIVAAGEEKFLIAGDIERTSLISKLDTKKLGNEGFSAIATSEVENYQTQSVTKSMADLPLKRKYTDSGIGIRASQLSAKLNNENSYASVMRSLASKMNATSLGGNQ